MFDGKQSHLNLRQFEDWQKQTMYERQQGICPHCGKEKREKIKFAFEEMEADHIKHWHEGGKTEIDNGQMLCIEHNRKKSGK